MDEIYVEYFEILQKFYINCIEKAFIFSIVIFVKNVPLYRTFLAGLRINPTNIFLNELFFK